MPGGVAATTGDGKDDEDLDYYIREAGEIVGLSQALASKQSSPEPLTAMRLVAFALRELVEFKKVSPGGDEPEEPRVRRAGEEEVSSNEHRTAADVLASAEPVKKRAQLAHLGAPSDAKPAIQQAEPWQKDDDDDAPGGRPKSSAGRGRAPLAAFDSGDVAEAKDSGNGAEVMSFK